MMVAVNDNRGYALVIVLVVIALIGVLTPSIIISIKNNAMQFQRSADDLQLGHLRDMGETYVQKATGLASERARDKVTETLKKSENGQIRNEEILHLFYIELEKELAAMELAPQTELPVILDEEGNQFKLEVRAEPDFINKSVKIHYTVSPSLDGQYDETKQTTGEITIQVNI